ncbi:MAG: NfeD family protein [Eubacteriales bacterium]|nr:NfeD family protein [Eubacteriales bacterium]
MLQWIANNGTLLLCFVFGVLLLVVEAIIPGIGVAGIAGLVFSLISIVLTAIHFGPVATIGITLVLVSLCVFAFSITIKSLQKGKLSKYVLKTQENSVAGSEQMQELLGKEGQTQSELRPAGIAIIDGKRIDVVSRGGFIQKGANVKVVQIVDLKIIVEEC